MTQAFKTIALIGKPNHNGANQTVMALYDWLAAQGYKLLVEERTAQGLALPQECLRDLASLGEEAELAIVVGGDGNMLGAARVLARFDVAVIGVNRGNLGFLTDLSPEGFEGPLSEVLAGRFQTEYRFLLDAQIYRHKRLVASNTAVNEMVLHPDKIAHMIEFSVSIDEQFVYTQRSDGLIVSTPTGSTAYSLSGGGPILHPKMDAIVLLPMFPHTLSSRPIVVEGNSLITLMVTSNTDDLQITCDSQVVLGLKPGDEIRIQKSAYPLRLVHPPSYDYYQVLRSKLGWSSKLY
ncbi:NAD(+) kinase [Gallaecimonas xiamenensis]|uniref:NAD kinase n=1 Tax=Gallaecimonas xiamenensis 3-C-1 TaxID=745411 RepID=K2K9K9_9GAMM|nr:NAD(+) kinase [Gallaecimonas xiamenensis]EKE74000.1 inorganic polyphosphate/ATP-NAD kinase [Gallaecimonas xiamenensis 3-C-1]